MYKAVRTLAVALLAGLIVAAGGCSDDGPAGPEMGVLEVNLSMSGLDVDPNGGTFWIDGNSVGPLFVDVTLSVDEIEVGVYVIEVTGIADNCALLGQNPRNVRIRSNETAVEDFAYICESTGGKDDGGDPKDPPAL